MRPGDLLKFEVINWGRASGKKRFVLGGGHTPMDGIFQYKQAFAPDGIEPFYIGKQIFNEEQYNRLIARKRELNPAWTPSESFFPQYRS